MGSAKFVTNCKGLSSTPIAKITRYLIYHRRVVLTPEQFTTCRCFGCKNTVFGKEIDKMKEFKGNQIKENFKGEKYHVKIHGLKQCVNCRKFWNRDYHASLNIGKAFVDLNLTGQRPLYLTNFRKNLGSHTQAESCNSFPNATICGSIYSGS